MGAHHQNGIEQVEYQINLAGRNIRRYGRSDSSVSGSASRIRSEVR
nr:MAG TPA: hypothetical protein [Caudoviricetes sp.]